jgi:TonB-linked SusC/RagA family outer membrane protein
MRSLRLLTPLLGLLAAIQLCNVTAWAQNNIAYNNHSTKDLFSPAVLKSMNVKQTLFSVMKELNRDKGVYFLFSEEGMGNTLVNPIKDITVNVDKILDDILKDTGLKHKKVSDNTFVILNAKERFKNSHDYKEPEFQQAISVSETYSLKFDLISGKITNGDGTPVQGASILVKGTSRGTSTNARGEFSIEANRGDVLVISSVGYISQEMAIGDNKSLSVSLVLATQEISEVVVTALGVKREKKALGYSIQEVDGKNLTEARENNIINSLAGRVAGLQLYKTGNGPTGSTRIVIRGNNSLGGNNQPLIVVDGVPMDNYQSATGQSEYGSFDGGNGISDINPDDVETVTVLKGPAAAALYGTRGGNGVLLITTKKGVARKGLGVRVNSNYEIDNPLLYPDLQNAYGQGSDGVYNVKSQSSWGPKITGQQITDWRGKQVAMSADPDDLKNFLQTGKTWTNSVDISGGNDKTVFRLGYTNLDNKGLLPNTTLKRDLVTLRVNSDLTTRLSVDAKVSYANQRTFNRPQLSGSPYNVFANYYSLPRTVHLADMNPWKDIYGHQILWQPEFYSTLANPYWILNEDFNRDQSDRFLTMLSLDYKFTNWLKLKLRHGMDMRNASSEAATAYGIYNNNSVSPTYNSFSGYGSSRTRVVETNADFLLSANKKFNDFTVGLSVGGNQQRSTYNNVGGNTGILDLPNVYTLSAGSNPKPYSSKAESRLNSLYSFLNLSYKDYIYADVTFRNDWSSTLSPENRSFHYPSFSGSLIVTDMLRNEFNTSLPSFISFFKIRGGYAKAGNTIGPYQLAESYVISRGFFDAITTVPPKILVNPGILPEIVKSQEYGVDLRFLKNRIGIDFTYYKKNAYNQIIYLPAPAATGYNFKVINAGNLQNQGFEFVVNASILKLKSGFNWDVMVNYNHNVNKVVALHPDIKSYALQGDEQSRAIRVLANEGEIYGNMYGRDFARNNKGEIIVELDGTPRKSENKNVLIGNYQPKYTMGISNTFSYKRLSFGFLIDIRGGGQFYSQTMAYMYNNGNARGTLPNREGGMIVQGVKPDNSKNTTAITSQQYWSKVGGAEPVASLFIYDASNSRLREATLGYSIPNKIFGKLPVRNVTLSIVGRNLWLIKSHIPGIDPESSFSTTNSQGIENGTYPSTRTLGVNLKLEF